MEQRFNEQESLKLINEMIGKAKHSYVAKGIASIVWGLLIIICSLVTWAQIEYKLYVGIDIWLLVFFAVIPQIYFSVKERKQKKFVAHDEQTMTYVWTAFGICIFIATYYSNKFGNAEMATIFMMLYGIPTFITGGIFNCKPMILGGIICWIFSIISLYTPISTDMLLMAASGLFAWLIPGIILWNKYQKQKDNV
jgi:hypothetical protein